MFAWAAPTWARAAVPQGKGGPMQRPILITGATDGIGLATAKLLAADGRRILLHGRSRRKLNAAAAEIGGDTESYVADLSRIGDVEALAAEVTAKHSSGLSALVNNAGVLKTGSPVTDAGLDVRFMVNAIAPYVLTRRLLPLIGATGRVINLSSAAQAPVDLDALAGKTRLEAMPAYSQSKLAITMWSLAMAKELPNGPAVIAVNPGSLLGTKMVREGFGMTGSDINIGADIVRRLAVAEEFQGVSGKYFDNDVGSFGSPHRDALNTAKSRKVIDAIEEIVETLSQ